MDPVKLANNLTLLGITIVAAAIVFWLFATTSLVGNFGVNIINAIPCLFYSGGVCLLVNSFGGYHPLLLWFGVALIGGGWLVRQSLDGVDRQNVSSRTPRGSGADLAVMARDISRDVAARAQRAVSPETSRARRPVPAPIRSAFAAKNYAPDPQIRLVRLDGGRSIALKSGRLRAASVVLGRLSTSDEVVDGTTISRRHAKLWIDDRGRLLIEDLGSANGTWLDGQRIARATLVNGAQLRLGDVEFRAALDEF